MKRMHWLFGIVSMICLAWLARADTVKLKDGTLLEGTITEEDAISITIQMEDANGAVTGKRWALKSDIAEIHRTTPEEKAARDMELAFPPLQKLQLDATKSFQLEYYDRTLSNVFQKFLTDYPNSSHTNEVRDKIAEWEAERKLVASGKVKVNGRWISAKEIADREAREAVQQSYQQGVAFLKQKRFGEALEQFEIVIGKSDDAAQVQRARQLRTDTYQQWLTALERQRQQLATEVKKLEQRVTDARNAKDKAEGKLPKLTPSPGNIRARALALGAPRDGGGGEGARLEADTDRSQTLAAVTRTRLELQAAENQFATARGQAAAVEEMFTRVQAQAAALGITIASSGEGTATQVVAVATRPAPPAPSAETPDVVTGIWQFLTAYWIYILAGFVIVLWLVSRAFR